MSCVNDDMAGGCTNCTCQRKIVACIPAFGRFSLLRFNIERLYKVNKVFKVIVAGHEHAVQKICKDTRAEFVQQRNNPLGLKWNKAFKEAKKYNPDAVLFVGSSDLISENWLTESIRHLKDYEMVGKLGCYLLDINTHSGKRLCFWPGYPPGRRENEPIGIGRLISARILEKINWEPFDGQRNNSMDSTMYHRILAKGGKVKVMMDENPVSMAISTNLWANKHKFEMHWDSVLPSTRIQGEAMDTFLKNNFPDIENLKLTL